MGNFRCHFVSFQNSIRFMERKSITVRFISILHPYLTKKRLPLRSHFNNLNTRTINGII